MTIHIHVVGVGRFPHYQSSITHLGSEYKVMSILVHWIQGSLSQGNLGDFIKSQDLLLNHLKEASKVDVVNGKLSTSPFTSETHGAVGRAHLNGAPRFSFHRTSQTHSPHCPIFSSWRARDAPLCYFSAWPLISCPPHISASPSLKCVCVLSCSLMSLCDPMDCSLPGSSVHRIFHTKILERIAISFSRGSSSRLLHLLHWQVDTLALHHLGSPIKEVTIL